MIAACRAAAGADVDLQPLAERAGMRDAIDLAHRLCVAGVVASQLTASDPAWQRTLSANLARNLYLLERARAAQRALALAGVPCLVLKGLPLSQFAYGSIAIRECGDIDLLVSPARVLVAVEALEREGFLSRGFCTPMIENEREFCEVPLYPDGAKSQFLIDLHWAVRLPEPLSGSISEDWLEQSSHQRNGLTDDLPSMGPVELSLHAIVHWLQHGPLLKTLTDMAACRGRDSAAWSEALRRAELRGWGEVARVADREAAAFFGGRPSQLPLRIGGTAQLLRAPSELNSFEIFFARALVIGRPRAVLAAAVRGLGRGFRAGPCDSRPSRVRLRRAMSRAPRALWSLGRYAARLMARSD